MRIDDVHVLDLNMFFNAVLLIDALRKLEVSAFVNAEDAQLTYLSTLRVTVSSARFLKDEQSDGPSISAHVGKPQAHAINTCI